MNNKKTITIISPTFNEQNNVEHCYEEIKKLFKNELINYNREHIFVDNDSIDDTVPILKKIAATDSSVKIIVNSRNFGPLPSTFNALKNSSGDATIVMMAVDLQDPPELISEFVRHWEKGHKVVQGKRIERDEGPLLHLTRRLYYRTVKLLSNIEIPIDVGEFQLIDKDVLNELKLFNDHDPYIRGLIAYTGFKPYTVEYKWRARERGISKNRLLTLIDIGINGLLSFSKAPIRYMTFMGLILAIGSLSYAFINLFWLLFIIEKIISPGIPTLIVAIFFFSGIQLFMLGILGEYIVSIHHQVRFGGKVIEKERINFD
jgi:glycosyltransferase involved in cell wall biosynthesis